MLSSPLTVGLHIDGDIRPSSSGGVFCTVDPATGETLGTVQAASDSDVDAAVAAARRAFDDGPWPRLPAAHRSAILYSIAQLLEDSIEELAVLESRDTGMPITMTRHGHLPRAIAHFRYFAEEAERSKGESFPRDDAYLYVVNREPLGVAVERAARGGIH